MPWLAAQAINSLQWGDMATPRRWMQSVFSFAGP